MSEREAKRLGRRPMEVGAGGGDLEKPLSLALAVGSGEQWPGEENGRPKFQGREWGGHAATNHRRWVPLPSELKSRC